MEKLKIYLLKRTDYFDWDNYEAIIVCAFNEDDALSIGPNNESFEESQSSDQWAKYKEYIECTEIGTANNEQKRGVILESYVSG